MTRAEILETAAQIFREKGFHGTSMQDIAQAVNLKKASLYHHISSKQGILLALLDDALDLLIERITVVKNQKIPPEEKLRQAIACYLQILAEHRDLSAVLLFEHRSLDRDLHAKHVPRRDRFESIWREMIQEGMQQGTFSQMDASLAARALMGVMNWTLTWYRLDGSLSVHEIAYEYTDLILKGLLVRPQVAAD